MITYLFELVRSELQQYKLFIGMGNRERQVQARRSKPTMTRALFSSEQNLTFFTTFNSIILVLLFYKSMIQKLFYTRFILKKSVVRITLSTRVKKSNTLYNFLLPLTNFYINKPCHCFVKIFYVM